MSAEPPFRLSRDDWERLGRHLTSLTNWHADQGLDPRLVHLEILQMVTGWLLMNDVEANDLRQVVDEFVTRFEQDHQAELAQITVL